MGLRGIGARPKASDRDLKGTTRKKVRSGRPTWQAKGLTRADRVIRFIESLTITSGAHVGRSFILRPWQREIIMAWYRTDAQGRRIVRTGLLSLGRKNGKSSLVSALGLAHLVGPEVEPRGQICAAAVDRDQSGLIFDEIVAFILADEAFAARCNIKRHSKTIEDLESGSTFRALSSDAQKAHGLSPSVILVDELAQWDVSRGAGPGPSSGRALYEALTTATGARSEPLTLVISTQSADEHSLMTELVEYGKQVTAGAVHDPTFSAFLYEVPLDADPWDETVWPRANPALGDFRSLEEMRTFAARAQQMPRLVPVFRQYYLNQRVAAEGRWLSLDAWDQCADDAPASLTGRRAYLGLDLASVQDLTALAIVCPRDDGGVDLRVETWVPQDTLAERERVDHVPYRLWAEAGWLAATDGNTCDYSVVEARLYQLLAELDVQVIGIDPWSARDLTTRLQRNGAPAVEVPQTLRNLSAAAKKFEELILARRLFHDKNPVLKWAVGNCIVTQDGNENLRPDKKRSPEKIDPVSATITALAQWLVAAGPSVYEARPPELVDL